MAPQADVPVVAARGASFLVEERTPDEVFTPEDLSEEQRMIGDAAAEFMESEVLPRLPEILALDYRATRATLRKAGDLGLLGIEIPEAYGGLGLGKVAGCLACERLARDASFVLSFLAHTGMGTLPIVYFGTDEQKTKYLPKFASGEWISSYSLSEASSASDALNARARAVLSPDRQHWIVDGEKMWLTNAGVADVYITFAKVNGERLSAFIVEKGMPGVSLGPEERKAGLRGSSTRPLILSGAKVPRGNLLGEVGRGFAIALGSLNIGRFKLAAANTAASKIALKAAVEYGKTRTAFGRPITDFGLVKHKIGEMAILAYAGESVVYRTAAMVDRNLESAGDEAAQAIRRIQEYDVECSIVKVWCSEALDYAVDEYVQILGGAGYVEGHAAERSWRDARVNRIFEGTNEINRLLIASRLVRRVLKGELPLFGEAQAPADRVGSGPAPAEQGFLAAEESMLAGAKKVTLLCLGASMRRYREALGEEQEVLGLVADLAMETYALESALLRARKRAHGRGEQGARLQEAAVRCFAQDALDRIEVSARRLLAAVEEGDKLRGLLADLGQATKRETLNTVAMRRLIADAAVKAEGYPLS
jgi:alkylation response protein AidB-like acyl-CoA dehydrogenase